MYIRTGNIFITQGYSRKYHFNDGNIGLFDCTSIFTNMCLQIQRICRGINSKKTVHIPVEQTDRQFLCG